MIAVEIAINGTAIDWNKWIFAVFIRQVNRSLTSIPETGLSTFIHQCTFLFRQSKLDEKKTNENGSQRRVGHQPAHPYWPWLFNQSKERREQSKYNQWKYLWALVVDDHHLADVCLGLCFSFFMEKEVEFQSENLYKAMNEQINIKAQLLRKKTTNKNRLSYRQTFTWSTNSNFISSKMLRG